MMLRRQIWLPAVLTLLVVVVGLLFWPASFLQSWLAAAVTWGAIPLGALPILMIHGLTGGRWGDQSRRVWLALVATLPLFVLSLVPLVLAMETLFAWTQPEHLLPDVVKRKQFYLNLPFFVTRLVIYCGIWLALAWMQGLWRSPDSSGAGIGGRGPQGLHAPGLILWVLSITFFSFDWFMSLEPKFYSDVFGLMLCTNLAGVALAVGLLVGGTGMEAGPRKDLANLWLAFLLGWAFLAFSQYIIIWSGNLPDEIGWYIHRSEPVWREISVMSFLLFFLVPFFMLLPSRAKERQSWLSTVAMLCLAGHVLQLQWLILPAFGPLKIEQMILTPLILVVTGATYLGWIRGYTAMQGARHG
ncbi:hypothetical protein [Marinobacter fonticola]|uniref:hypothetical protein n=1 Tax=Marinobacter fonticola TaxID=2603215 RepID=UPI0011E88078|nr:hypothetical protein [Marinobacter fonticola]